MTPVIEFSHIISIETWPEDGIIVDLAATPAECRGLKDRFGLVDLGSLTASGKIEKSGMDLVFTGMIEAEVVQSCVATLRPIEATLQLAFERRFRCLASLKKTEALERDEDSLDDVTNIEIIENDEIDVGEVIAEEFYLGLEPYPRTADADQVLAEMQGTAAELAADKIDTPFDKLRQH